MKIKESLEGLTEKGLENKTAEKEGLGHPESVLEVRDQGRLGHLADERNSLEGIAEISEDLEGLTKNRQSIQKAFTTRWLQMLVRKLLCHILCEIFFQKQLKCN